LTGRSTAARHGTAQRLPEYQVNTRAKAAPDVGRTIPDRIFTFRPEPEHTMSATLKRGIVAGAIGLALSLGLATTAFADTAAEGVGSPSTPSGNVQPGAAGGTAEKPNTGGYHRSSEAQHKAIDCANYHDAFDFAIKQKDAKAAEDYLYILQKRGCYS
jgi:hypothetical protein